MKQNNAAAQGKQPWQQSKVLFCTMIGTSFVDAVAVANVAAAAAAAAVHATAEAAGGWRRREGVHTAPLELWPP